MTDPEHVHEIQAHIEALNVTLAAAANAGIYCQIQLQADPVWPLERLSHRRTSPTRHREGP